MQPSDVMKVPSTQTPAEAGAYADIRCCGRAVPEGITLTQLL